MEPIYLDRSRTLVALLRLRRDLAQHRKPPLVLLRRGLALWRAQPASGRRGGLPAPDAPGGRCAPGARLTGRPPTAPHVADSAPCAPCSPVVPARSPGAVVARILADGHDLTVMNRGHREPMPGGVRHLVADAHDVDAVRAALGDAEFDAPRCSSSHSSRRTSSATWRCCPDGWASTS